MSNIFRCNRGKYPLLNTIKKSFLNPESFSNTEQVKPLPEPANSIDDDFEDIEIKPAVSKPTITKPSTLAPKPITSATSKPTTTTEVQHDEVEDFKVVCYYTNWAWYRYAILTRF